ncbi:MAG TPA: endo-1,4-beta-xylanase [Opitutus sp.]|nr:endo-1,4-beta-xylanase [Opitutus sp.]
MPLTSILRSLFRASSLYVVLCAMAGFSPSVINAAEPAKTLREAAGDTLLIGCPVGVKDLDNPELLALILREFNCITVETEIMPFKLGADRDAFAFDQSDRVVEWVEKQGLPILGHMLVWDYRTPAWLFTDQEGTPLPRAQGLENLRYYIHKVMTHYKGRILAWNVVNEAISDEPGENLRDTLGRRSIGDDYVEKAFQFAEEADPDVQLYYNDYNVILPDKREKTLRLIRSLKQAGRRVDAIGLQGHWLIDRPPAHLINEAVEAFAAEGLKVMITELDIDVLPRTVSGANMQTVDHGPNPYPNGLPDVVQAQLTELYRSVFERLMKHRAVVNITFWGSHDGRSWLNNFPVRGRTNHALLFDRQLKNKPAHAAVLNEFAKAAANRESRGVD